MILYTLRTTTDNNIRSVPVMLLLLSSLVVLTYLRSEPTSAHLFVPDKNASLLALIHQIKTELELINYNMKYNGNNDLALEHVGHVIEIQTKDNLSSSSPPPLPGASDLRDVIKANPDEPPASIINEKINDTVDFLDEKIASKINDAVLKNSTIQALTIANITDEILREYAMAYGIQPVITNSMLNMNMSGMTSSTSRPSLSSSMVMENNNMQQPLTTDERHTPNATTIVSVANYQNAQSLANKALEIFRKDLQPLGLPEDATNAITLTAIRTTSFTELENSLSMLIDSINKKVPYSDIMEIIHGPVHTDLFLAYNLKMISD
jgi:hypothetical protein